MSFDTFSRNGEILPAEQATIPLANIEYAYGFGVYETIRAVRGTALFLDQHTVRLMTSANVIGLEHAFTAAQVAKWTNALLASIKADACNFKILLVGGRTKQDALLFIIPLAPLFPDKKLFSRGATAITVRHERFMPHAKTLNMLPSFMAYRRAKEHGCYDALFTDKDDCITEGTRTNFFAIKDRTILCPPAKDILEGVTLVNVLRVAKENNFLLKEQPIPLASLAETDGAFLTSTSSKIMPLCKVDGHELAVPDALKELIRHFDAFLATVLPA